jgi:hypothetical protein
MSALIRGAGAMALVAAIGSPAPAQQPLQASPVTPGFWTWPREKTVGEQAIGDACQDKIAVQFADGRYFGLKLRGSDKKTASAPVVDEVGLCKFDSATQLERCELRINQDDGSVKTGTIESAFLIEADRTIKMTVTPKIIDGKPVSDPSFDVFPTPCPDAIVWRVLNGEQIRK